VAFPGELHRLGRVGGTVSRAAATDADFGELHGYGRGHRQAVLLELSHEVFDAANEVRRPSARGLTGA